MKLLSTAYFPSIAYFSILVKEEKVFLEKHENFIKQSHRNRCTIATPQGRLQLSIPLVQEGNKIITAHKKISYTENWQLKHWRAIESAYNKSAYFEYFEEEIKKIVFTKKELLFNFNLELVQQLLHLLRLKRELIETNEYKVTGDIEDYREEETISETIINFPSYYQVFSTKTGFLPNVSVLDLIFNEGLKSIKYLSELK